MPTALTTPQLDLIKRIRTLGRVYAPSLPPSQRRDAELLESVGVLNLTESRDFVLSSYGRDYLLKALSEDS